jgi:hypothetical protein
MLLRAGGVKLLDFGIAKAETVLPASTTRARTPDRPGQGQALLSRTGAGSATTARRALGHLLAGRGAVECLTGKRLFYEKTDYQTMHNVLERPVPPPSMQRPDVPPALDFIVVRALERMREQRYASAKAMADDLDHFLSESHFAAGSVPQMLDQLFGEDAMEVEKLPEPSAPQPAPKPVARVTLGALEEPSGSVSSASLPPVSLPSAQAWSAEAPPERRLERSSPRHALLVGGAAVLGIAAAIGLVVARRGPVSDSGVGSSAPVALSHAAEAATSPAPARVVPGLPHPSGTVFVRIESDPPGAEVRGPNGNPLGVTPTTAVFTRGSTPLTLTVSKAGYQGEPSGHHAGPRSLHHRHPARGDASHAPQPALVRSAAGQERAARDPAAGGAGRGDRGRASCGSVSGPQRARGGTARGLGRGPCPRPRGGPQTHASARGAAPAALARCRRHTAGNTGGVRPLRARLARD